MHIPHIIKKGHCTMKDMFCFQCQQTAHNTGCEGKAGVCGKKADTANYQDEIIGALIGLCPAPLKTADPRSPPTRWLKKRCSPPSPT